MKVSVDQILRQKLYVQKDGGRVFSIEFPSDSTTAELYGVITELQSSLWKSLEAEKSSKEAEKEKTEKPEVAKEEMAKEEVAEPEAVEEAPAE